MESYDNLTLTKAQREFRKKNLICSRCGSSYVIARKFYRVCKKCGFQMKPIGDKDETKETKA